MSLDRVDRTRAVTTRLTKRDPTNRKSVRERLRKIWHVGFREDRNVGGPSRLDKGRHDRSKIEILSSFYKNKNTREFANTKSSVSFRLSLITV